jgi:uncharacterized membrane protein
MSGYDAGLAARQKHTTALTLTFIVVTWGFFVAVDVMASHRPLNGVTVGRAFGSAAAALIFAAIVPWIVWGISRLIRKPRHFSFVLWAVCLAGISCLMLVGKGVLGS